VFPKRLPKFKKNDVCRFRDLLIGSRSFDNRLCVVVRFLGQNREGIPCYQVKFRSDETNRWETEKDVMEYELQLVERKTEEEE